MIFPHRDKSTTDTRLSNPPKYRCEKCGKQTTFLSKQDTWDRGVCLECFIGGAGILGSKNNG